MNTIRICLQSLLLCLFISYLGSSVYAETLLNEVNNPSMTSKSYFTDDNGKTLKHLKIKKLDISVTHNNAYTETHILVDFYNPTEDQLEGDFVLDMPYGSIVTGYGLDIDGRMVAGVIVEKEQAKKIFEDRIREGVDPGLAEVTRENAFKSRVFPINAHQTRSISISFASPVSPTKPFILPLVTNESIDNFSLEVISNRLDQIAHIKLPSYLEFTEKAENKINSTSIRRLKASDVVLQGSLKIVPKELRQVSIERHVNDNAFLAVNLLLESIETSRPNKIKKIRVYWDSSLSQEENSQQATEFMQDIAVNFKGAEFELIGFSDSSKQLLKTKSSDKFIKALNDIVYHSATNIEHLFIPNKKNIPADLCLLVSDGHTTLGQFPQGTLPCKLFTISASTDSNNSSLGLLAKYSGGQHINLNRLSNAEGIKALNSSLPRLINVALNGVNKTDQAEWNTDADVLRVLIPISKTDNKVSLQFESKDIDIDFSQEDVIQGNSHSSFWATQRIDSSRAKGYSRKNLVDVSKKYSVASLETSFLVLESVEDYVENAVSLPKDGFDNELREKYAELMSQKADYEQDAKDRRFTDMLSQWNDQLEWYEKDFKFNFSSKFKKRVQSLMSSDTDSESLREVASYANEAREMAGDAEFEEVVVTGARLTNAENDKSISIDIKAWSPDRVYLKAVETLCGQEFMSVYFIQRDQFGDSPSFYLEMADALARCDETYGAIKIALSALELSTVNKDTITAVAQRLQSFRSYHTAIELLDQVVDLEPNSPQPYRNLALALEQQADNLEFQLKKIDLYEQALSLLNKIIVNPWENNYRGIGLISIMEANLIRNKLVDLDANPDILDKRLVALLDVDVRILISWNIDRTDVDLWIDEPTGERVSYSNKLSEIGGRISNDMTNGYGPEEYLLKKTIDGDYEIKVHYYGSDIINPNGAVIVRAHIFRNWGRANQSVEVADLEFTEQQSDEYKVATLKVR